MSSSNDIICFSRRVGQMTWLEEIVNNIPVSVAKIGLDVSDYIDWSPHITKHDCFPCPDEVEWFRSRGLKFSFNCIGDCGLCVTQFLLDPKVYEFTTLGEIDDPFLETEKKLSV